jgi:hypothetical protein
VAARARGEPRVGGRRNLVLQHHDRRRVEPIVGNIGGDDLAVSASDHDDRVLAGRRDLDEGDAGRASDLAHARDVDARRADELESRRRERVAADRPDELHRRAGAGGRDRLVRALAARVRGEAVARERLPRLHEARDARDEIEVDRSADDDHFGAVPVDGATARARSG